MKRILLFGTVLLSTAALHGATIVAGCVTDANGKAVAGAKVFAMPERFDKTYRAQTRKSDGCYEMKIAKDGVYEVGVRDARFVRDGPVQRYVTASGLDLPTIDLSTDVPNAKLLTQRVTDAVLSASEGFARVRRGVRNGDVPVITAEVPSGFGSCVLQSSNNQDGPTAMWWCTGFGGVRDETAHTMFESIRDSITTALGGLGQLRYSPLKPADGGCYDCVDRAIWASPINGVVSLSQTKDKKWNSLVLWAAYNSPMTGQGCASIQKNEEPKVDLATYDSAVNAMRAEYARQMNAAMKAELRNLFGGVVGGPGFIGSAQQSGLTGASIVSPNACLANGGPSALRSDVAPLAATSPKGDSRNDTPKELMSVSSPAKMDSGAGDVRCQKVTRIVINGKPEKEPLTQTILYKGKRQASITQKSTSIVDLAKGVIIQLNHDKKTYQQYTLDEWMVSNLKPVLKSQSKLFGIDKKSSDFVWKWTARDTADTKIVDGVEAKQVVVTGVLEAVNAQDLGDRHMMTSEMWVVPEPRGMDQVRTFQKLWAAELSHLPSEDFPPETHPGLARGIGGTDYMSDVLRHSVPVHTVTTGPECSIFKKVYSPVSSSDLKWSTDTVDSSQFEIPPGYREIKPKMEVKKKK